MSAPIQNDIEDHGRESPSVFPTTMYAPPWARDAATDAADAALAATERLRRSLPPAPALKEPERRRREPAPFEGDVALRELRARGPLDPVAMPEPPRPRARRSAFPLVMRLSGAVGLAALVAFLMVSAAPGSLRGAVAAVEASARPLWSRMFGVSTVRDAMAPAERKVEKAERAEPLVEQPVSLKERFAAALPMPEAPATAMQAPAPVAAAPLPKSESQAAPTPSAPARSLDSDEIAELYRRGEQLIQQGDIAAARLMFARGAEVGDARSALALGASYDPEVLKQLGVFGVAADAALARDWYAKASRFGSPEAAQRIELLAQGR